jgi:hypothetical protein
VDLTNHDWCACVRVQGVGCVFAELMLRRPFMGGPFLRGGKTGERVTEDQRERLKYRGMYVVLRRTHARTHAITHYRRIVAAAACSLARSLPFIPETHCRTTGLFLSFPYVCPEPVLVKSSLLYING